MMKKVIIDCDNTFGLSGRDVDDGLTLLYLTGRPTIELVGVTLTHGNGTLAEVAAATTQFKKIFEKTFDFYLGSETGSSAASDFLVAQAAAYPGELTVIATGALTNIAQAARQDPTFFTKLKQLILMGGTTQPLVVNEVPVSELNFASDPQAAASVLTSGAKLAIMNGPLTAQAFFSQAEQATLIQKLHGRLSWSAEEFLTHTLTDWIAWNEKVFHFSGFCNWDLATAIYLEYPELFSNERYFLADTQLGLATGQLTLVERSDLPLVMPQRLLDVATFNQLMIAGIVAGFRKDDPQ